MRIRFVVTFFLVLIMPVNLASAGVMSLQMLENRAITALSHLYSSKFDGEAVSCTAQRLNFEGERTGFAIQCLHEGDNSFDHLWLATVALGEIVELSPLTTKAYALSPEAGEGLLPSNDPGFLRITHQKMQIRCDIFERAKELFD